MKLYHGSTLEIKNPDVSKSRTNLDFGRGFYATSIKEQAERWARRRALLGGGKPIVSIYDFSNNLDSIKKLNFPNANKEWVEFICACRRGSKMYKKYDLIIGGVADDKVYEAVNMYLEGLWDIETTLGALVFYEVNDQYCFVSQDAANRLLTFESSYEVEQ